MELLVNWSVNDTTLITTMTLNTLSYILCSTDLETSDNYTYSLDDSEVDGFVRYLDSSILCAKSQHSSNTTEEFYFFFKAHLNLEMDYFQ